MIEGNSEFDNPSIDNRKIVAKRFKIIEEIGSGGLSTVFKAQDLVLKRTLAVKLLKPKMMREDHLIRLQREAKAICQLNHPNIIDVYDFLVTEENVPLLAMEYVEGASLKEVVESSGPLSEEDALSLFEQICEALSFAHSRKILHRDLKPGNVLVGTFEDREQIKIIDFGIAKSLDIEDASMTTSGNVVGTPTYMSPEQGKGENLDNRSDIYALGCLMYKVLTGEAPFQGDSLVEVVNKQIHQSAPTLKQANDSLSFSPEIEKLVAKALMKDPNNRFQSMDEIKSELVSLSMSSNKLAIAVPDFDKGSSSDFLKMLITTMIVILIMVPIGFGLHFLSQRDYREVDIETSDKTFAIRKKFGIGHKYVQDKFWLTLRGKVTKEQLKAICKLNVPRIDISNSTFDNESLVELVNAPLMILDARNSNLSDKGLETISKIGSIRSLILGRCPDLTHVGYRSIKQLKDLEILDLRDSTISDADLKVLSNLKKMMVIYLSNSPEITDKSIDQILKMKSLHSIRLGGTKATKTGINRLKEHPKLVFIGLRGNNLSYSNMPTFSQKIAMLDLSNSNLEDRCLARIYAMKNLWYINIRNCKRLSIPQHNRILAAFDIQLGKAARSEHTPDFPDIEWYLDPDNYKTAVGDRVDLRRKLIRSAINGDPEL